MTENEEKHKCDFPGCEKTAVINFGTGDGKQHHYCSVDHANDHRNILIANMMRGTGL